jgi:hypothetical protein
MAINLNYSFICKKYFKTNYQTETYDITIKPDGSTKIIEGGRGA